MSNIAPLARVPVVVGFLHLLDISQVHTPSIRVVAYSYPSAHVLRFFELVQDGVSVNPRVYFLNTPTKRFKSPEEDPLERGVLAASRALVLTLPLLRFEPQFARCV